MNVHSRINEKEAIIWILNKSQPKWVKTSYFVNMSAQPLFGVVEAHHQYENHSLELQKLLRRVIRGLQTFEALKTLKLLKTSKNQIWFDLPPKWHKRQNIPRRIHLRQWTSSRQSQCVSRYGEPLLDVLVTFSEYSHLTSVYPKWTSFSHFSTFHLPSVYPKTKTYIHSRSWTPFSDFLK